MTMVLFASGIMFISAMAEAKIKFERFHKEIIIEVPTIKEINVIKPKLEAKIKMPVVKNHSTFLDAIGFRESSNNYKAVNQFGYLGKYQFGRKTLNAIGFENISNREFLANPSIQEEAMLVLLKRNKHTLRREIKKYVGKIINGIYITESGILAAAHLGGAGNVKKFFRKGYEFKDGNGTKMTSYMKRFANYQLNI
ncbi:transglycosylase family protein [bacterium]|nr:transglycosylase family protein [bacterium]